MTLQEMLLREFDEEMKRTGKILECVPEDRLAWQPHAKSMLLGRLAGHVAELPGRAASIIETDTWVRMPGQARFSATSQAELMEKFETESKAGRNAIANLKEEQLEGTWSIRLGDKTMLETPRWMALRMVCLNHLIHHRAQLGVYLRLLDVPLPGTYGPSADEMARG